MLLGNEFKITISHTYNSLESNKIDQIYLRINDDNP